MYGLTRGTLTLIGVAVAGVLLWLATRFGFDGSTAEFWTTVGLLAAAGFAIALSQLLGGWTKWGMPRISPTVFLLGFLPALVVGGLALLALQPDGATMQATAEGWVNDVGLGWLLGDVVAMLPVIAFALGLVLGLTLDTAGPHVDEDVEVVDERDRVHPHAYDADEPVTAERRTAAHDDDGHRVDDEYREPDRDVVHSLGSRDEPVSRRDGDVEVREGGHTVRPRDDR